MLKPVTIIAALAALVVPSGRSAPLPPPPVCIPLPPGLLDSYFRADDRNWQLELRVDCTFRAAQRGLDEGGGDYALSDGDASGGTFVLSNDSGCRQPGMQDVPTPYSYSVEHGVLLLEPIGGASADLCVNSKGEGRAHDLAGHGGWLRSIAGKTTLTLKGAKRGSFKVSGALADKGSFKVLRSKVVRRVKTATLRFSGANGTFTLTEHVKKRKVTWELVGKATWSYAGLAGSGKGTAKASRQSLRGDVSN